MKNRMFESLMGKFRLVLLVLLFIFGLFSIIGSGGGGGSSSDSGTTPGNGTTPGDGTTPATIEQDIRSKADALLSVLTSEGVNEGMDVITSLLEDPNLQNLITINPETIDLGNLPESVTISLNFGAGYTTADGNLWTGSGTIQITGIQFTETALGADFTATFNNIAVNGSTYLNGIVQGSISITQDAQENMALSGSIEFLGFQWNGNPFSGSITLSGTIQGLDLENPSGTITVTFNQLVMGQDRISGSASLTMGSGTDPDSFVISFSNLIINDFTFSSGTVTVSSAGEDRWAVDMDVTTSEGPFDIVVYLTIVEDANGELTEIILHTETLGTMGPYQVTMNNVIIPDDWETEPASGTMTFTKDGKTATLDFNGKYLFDNPPYEYNESS
jgi:hypothetical protein